MEKFSSHFFLEIVCGVFVSVTMDWGGGVRTFLLCEPLTSCHIFLNFNWTCVPSYRFPSSKITN